MFLDERGLLLSPLLRRTWSPCGQRPVLVQRTRHHQKVSVIAALALSQRRRRVRLCFRLHPGLSVESSRVTAFLRQLARQIRGPVIVIWDRLQAHRSRLVRAFATRWRRFHFEEFPPYAPELNPVEYGWCWLKTNPLANHAPEDALELARLARHHAGCLQHRPSLLWSFIDHSPLPLRHK